MCQHQQLKQQVQQQEQAKAAEPHGVNVVAKRLVDELARAEEGDNGFLVCSRQRLVRVL